MQTNLRAKYKSKCVQISGMYMVHAAGLCRGAYNADVKVERAWRHGVTLVTPHNGRQLCHPPALTPLLNGHHLMCGKTSSVSPIVHTQL